jgi:hypothetical protein
VSDYRRFPPDPPARRNVWILICVVALLLLANLAHQGGVG